MAVINNDYQTNLLFKRFTGVAATQLDSQFSNEPFRSIKNIFSRDVFIEDIPDQAPISIYNLDNSGNWLDSDASGNPSKDGGGNTFIDLYPDSKLQFYKNVELTQVPGAQARVWRRLDAGGENILQDTINFKYDDINSTYLMRVKYSNGAVYINNPLNSFPLFWVLDNQSGYLQFYQTTATLLSMANIPTDPPKISFFKYVGKKGITNLDVSGQQQVGDISGIDADISGINIKLDEINRMILPEGYVDISGATPPYDLSGAEVVRTYFNYVRSNSFIGYHNLPVMDSSGAVDHAGDPSHNIVGLEGTDLSGVSVFELDISGGAYISKGIVLGPSGGIWIESVSGDTHTIGSGTTGDMEMTTSNHFAVHTQKPNALFVAAGGNVGIGTPVPGAALHVMANSTALDISGEAIFRGDVLIEAPMAGVASFYQHGAIEFFRDVSMGTHQITNIMDATDPSGVPSLGQVHTLVDASSHWILNGSDIYYNAGNVGIGTDVPNYKLDVSGESVFRGDVKVGGLADISGSVEIWGVCGLRSNVKMHMDADVSGNLNVQETRILQSSRIEWPLSLAVVAPYTFPIAQLTMNNTGTNLVGYFTLELSNGPINYEYTQSIHFLAGYIACSAGGGMIDPLVFIKVLSNNKKDLTGAGYLINQLSLFVDPFPPITIGQRISLCCKTNATNLLPVPGVLNVRLYKNFEGGVGAPATENWELTNPPGAAIPPGATELSGNLVNLNLYDEPYGFSGMIEHFQKNIVVEGNTLLTDVSCTNLEVSGNLIIGALQVPNLVVTGHSQLNDVSAANVDISENLLVEGHTLLTDVSAANVDISENLLVEGLTRLNDVETLNIRMAANNILDISNGWMQVNGRGIDASGLPGGGSYWGEVDPVNPNPPYQDQRGLRIQAQAITFDMIQGGGPARGVCFNLADYNGDSEFIIQGSNFTNDFVLAPGGQPGFGGCIADFSGSLIAHGKPGGGGGAGDYNLYVDGSSNLAGNVIIGGDLTIDGALTFGGNVNLDLSGNLDVSGDLTVDGTFINNNTQFVDYATLIITPPNLSENWYDIARIETASSIFDPDTYNAGAALFEIKCYSPDTSSNYTNIRCYATNFIEKAVSLQVMNCVTTNSTGTKTITGVRICTPGSINTPTNDGCLLQIALQNTTAPFNIQVRVYQNNTYLGSIPTFGRQWILDLSGSVNNNPSETIGGATNPVLFDEYYVADLTFNPNNSAGYTPGTNSGVYVSDLDNLFTGATKHGDLIDMSHNDISGCKDFSVETIEIKKIGNVSIEPMLTIDTSSNSTGLTFNATTKDSVLGNGTAITMAPLGGSIGKTYIETDLSGLTIYSLDPGFINLFTNGGGSLPAGDGGGLVKISSRGAGAFDQRSILHMDNRHTGFALEGKSEIILGPTDISSSEWYCSMRGENYTTNIFNQHSTFPIPKNNGGINTARGLGVYIQATGAPPPFRTGSYATISPQQAYILSSPPKTGDAAPATYYTTGYTTFGDSVIGIPSVASAHMDISGLSASSGPSFKLCTDEFQVIQFGDRAKPFVRINAGHNASSAGAAGTLSTTYLLANLVATPSLQGVRTIVGNGGNGSEYGFSDIEIMTGLHGIASGDIKIGVLNTNHVIIGNPNNSPAQYGIPEIHLGSATTCGYIDCGYASVPVPASATGPTNICAANHNGYIGTYGGSSLTGTGLRGYTMLALLKTYMAPNLSPLAGGGDFAPAIKYSCIEGPQGFTMFRGQVQLMGFSVAIDVDTAVVVGGGNLFIPHDNPQIAGAANPPGTFNAMFQNPMINVTNAGIWSGIIPPDAGTIVPLLDDPLWTRVRGTLAQEPIIGFDISNTHIKISADPAGTPDLVVNYIIYAERRDEGYIDNSQVRNYINPFTRSTKTWGSATDLSGNPFP